MVVLQQGFAVSIDAVNISNVGPVTFRRSARAKYERITVRPDKTVIVTFGRRGSLAEAKRFAAEKSDWIQKQLRRIDEFAQCEDGVQLDVDIEKTQRILFERLDYFSEKYDFPYNRAAFRCQKTRWGSCSGRNNISLNVNLAFLPRELQDYVLLHELVHTKVKNHSSQFWAELDKCTEGRSKVLSRQLNGYRMRLVQGGGFAGNWGLKKL